MKNAFRNVLIVLLFASTTAFAEPARESTIKQLLAVSQAQKLVDGMRAQIESLMNKSIEQTLNGKVPTTKQQQAITRMKSRTVALVQGELAWEKLEPMYLRLYQESFSEEEVAGILSFYKTPAGQAVINKMPVLMQKMMLEVQRMMVGTAPQMQKIQADFVAEMKTASN